MEVPKFIAEKCTGCAQCWTQCPDAAIPGLVSDPEDVLATAIAVASEQKPVERLRAVVKPFGKELRRVIGGNEYTDFPDAIRGA